VAVAEAVEVEVAAVVVAAVVVVEEAAAGLAPESCPQPESP